MKSCLHSYRCSCKDLRVYPRECNYTHESIICVKLRSWHTYEMHSVFFGKMGVTPVCGGVVPNVEWSKGAAARPRRPPADVASSSMPNAARGSRALLPAAATLPPLLPGRSLLTVNSCIKVRLDLQADKSPVVVKGPFFPRVVNPRYRISGTMCNARIQSSKAR
jgi:hypothetical protein